MDQRTAFGCLIVVTYSIYMICTWPNSPDGIILSAVIGALCALIGVKVGAQRATTHLQSIEDQEQSD